MKRKPHPKGKRSYAKTILRLPDLEIAKAAVINSLSCPDAQRAYRHAIDEFVDWYCSEPRLSFSKTVVVRYRMHLESRHLAPGTINLRLGAVRRLAYESADCGLLSADLAAGIRRVKGVKKLGVRLGNWLTPEQGNALWQAPDPERLRGKRNRALLAILLACGLRRHEIAELTVDHLQQREEHWAIVDLVGKGGHIRTIPVPDWVYRLLSDWTVAAGIQAGKLFRKVSSAGKPWGDRVTEKLVWHVVKEFAARIGNDRLAPHDQGGARQHRKIGAYFKDVASAIVNDRQWLSSFCRGYRAFLPLALICISCWDGRSPWHVFFYPFVQCGSCNFDLSDRKILVLARRRIVVAVMLQTEKGEIVGDAMRPSAIEVSDLAFLHFRVLVQMKADRTPSATLG